MKTNIVKMNMVDKEVTLTLDEFKRLERKLNILTVQNEVIKKYWIDLCNQILEEHDKDGWCRLMMTKEKALEMKKLFEDME